MNSVQSTQTHKAHVKTKGNKKINKIIFNCDYYYVYIYYYYVYHYDYYIYVCLFAVYLIVQCI